MLKTFLGGDRAVIRHCPLQLGLVETGQLALHHLKHLILVFIKIKFRASFSSVHLEVHREIKLSAGRVVLLVTGVEMARIAFSLE